MTTIETTDITQTTHIHPTLIASHPKLPRGLDTNRIFKTHGTKGKTFQESPRETEQAKNIKLSRIMIDIYRSLAKKENRIY